MFTCGVCVCVNRRPCAEDLRPAAKDVEFRIDADEGIFNAVVFWFELHLASYGSTHSHPHGYTPPSP